MWVLCQGHENPSSMLSFLYQRALDLTPLSGAVQLFFPHCRKEIFCICFWRGGGKQKLYDQHWQWHLYEDSLFYLYIYLICSLFMFLCLSWFSWECNINRLVSTFVFLNITYREFPGKTNWNKSLQQKWNKYQYDSTYMKQNTWTHYIVFYTKRH